MENPDPALVRYVEQVRSLVAERVPIPERADQICQAVQTLAAAEMKLPESCCQVGDCLYGRNLVYRDPDYGFVLISMVWPAGVDAPAHDHGTWCCVGVLEGAVRIIDYQADPVEPGRIVETRRADASAGASCSVLPPETDIHKICNPFETRAVTLHTYGKDILRCNTFDPEDCKVEEHELSYVNLA